MTPTDCESLLGPPQGFCSSACPDAPDQGCLHYLCLSGICRQSFCEDQPASFTGSECATPADCESLLGPLETVCVLQCPGSPNGGCMHYLCLAGICQTTYCK